MTEVRRQMSDDRGQRTEVRESEDGRQKAEFGSGKVECGKL